MRCLVTGATGYVGRRLVPALLAAGHTVRCLARDPDRLAAEAWAPEVEHTTGDVLDGTGLGAACEDVDVLYFLVHSLRDNDFRDLDRLAAENTAAAAKRAGVGRIVYLGGLGDPRSGLSAHLASRAEVADILLASDVPTTVLRAGIIIGAGSTSFEMLRHLAHRAPLLPNARWLDTRTQPIAVRDVLHYLVHAAGTGAGSNGAGPDLTLDIGGPEALRYRDMVRRFSKAAGLSAPLRLPAPAPPNPLSAWLAALLAPVDHNLAAQLIESLEHDMLCANDDVHAIMPEPRGGRLSFEDSVQAATAGVPPPAVRNATEPADAAWPLPADPPGSGGPVFTEQRVLHSSAAPEVIWPVIEGIGGEHGWYSLPLVWELRAGVERLLGNQEAVRGRTNPERLAAGQAVDWWRVHSVCRGERVVLTSTLHLPGTVWLEMSVRTATGSASEFRQRLFFAPRGATGEAYWYAVKPMHDLTFEVMARNIVRAAERRGTLSTPLVAAASITARSARSAVAATLRTLNNRLRDWPL